MKRKLLSLIGIQLIAFQLFAQTPLQGDQNNYKTHLKDAGNHGAACAEIQNMKQAPIQLRRAVVEPPCDKYVIPMVFHIVDQNPNKVTDAQIQSAIDILNEDFTATNSEVPGTIADYYKPLIGSLNIEFRLAKLDPNGNATTGIDRVTADGICSSTSSGNIAGNCPVKNTAPAWTPENYLNVWIINDVYGGTTNYSTSSGWAFLSSSVPYIVREEDGIVYNHIFLGREGSSEVDSYLGDMARVFTHEVGHYLNLKHTHTDYCSGGADDEVADTPPVKYNNCGSCCPSDVNNPADFYKSCDETTPIAVQSFMAYSGCPAMYTTGQANRMEESLQSQYRNNLWTEANQKLTGVWSCNPTSTMDQLNENDLKVYPNPFNDFLTIEIQKEGIQNINITDSKGAIIYAQLSKNSTVDKVNLSDIENGIYYINVQYKNGDLVSKFVVKQ